MVKARCDCDLFAIPYDESEPDGMSFHRNGCFHVVEIAGRTSAC